MCSTFSFVQNSQQEKGILPSSTPHFSAFLSGGFSLTFAELILWYVCNLSFLKYINISHLVVLSVLTQPEVSQSNTHMNDAYVVFKFEEQDT